MRVGCGAGCDDACDFAAHELLTGAGLLDLIADGDAIAATDEARDVALRRVVRDAAHGDGRAFFLVAGGEGDFEFARGDDGIVEEHLVEIAKAEQEQRTGNLLLDRVVLPHERRRGRFGVHEGK